MSNLYSSKYIITKLKKNGFIFVSQKGNHAKYKNKRRRLVVIVPVNKKEIPIGTFKSILR
jgi:predicted RNA binding protein YcfA (HicA-like mRNA interferase family)